ncbi:unnamed protein product [Musa acuminata subsp. malaccensis]|uniref:(wild Malaysian banana) hypothetical protein n=1 Tax=Musa acuminata subsp. malaccensis TaxID=214687 RepID=A0A8D7FBM8_MUSAM|nr:unnamed protein product [Musa acuminata subsp. malaccensis]
MDAGWKICIHSRKDGRKFDLIYYPPAEGAQLYSLSRAWISCGVELSANTSNIREEESGRVWTDINAFSGDLADVLEFIKMEIRHPENSLSLLQRWVLLDPFVAVVCINKKISALRKGTAVKAVNSMTTVLGGTESLGLLRSDVNGVLHNSRSLCSSERSLLSDIVSDGKSSALGCPAPDLRDKRNHHRVRQEHFFKASAESRSIRSLDGQKWKGCHDARDLLGRDSKASCMLHKLNLSSGVPKVIQKDSCLSSSLRLPTEAASQKNEKLFLNKILSADSPNKQSVVHPKEKRSHQDTDSLSKKAQLGRVDTQAFNAKEVTEQHRSSCSKGGHRVESSMEYPVAHENEVIEERKRTSGSYGNLSTANQSSQHQMNEQHNVLLYPPGGTLFFTMDDNQREPLLAHLVTTNANGSTNIHQQVQPLVYQANLVTGVFVVGTNNNMLYNVGFPVYQGVLNPHKRKKQRISRASKCETKQTFETPLVTKAQNKKNISKIKEAKMGGQTAIANPPSQNYREVVGFDGDEISESNSGCLKESSLEKKKSNSMLYNISISQEPHRESCLHTSVILLDGKLPFSGNNLEVSKVKRPEIFKENKQKQQSKGHANDDDLFIATIVKRKGCRSASREIISKVGSLDASEKLRSRNGDHKLFQNNAGEGGKISNVKRSIGRRTVLCRLIEMGVISVRNTFQYCELKDSTVVKDGRVTKNGILCRCCKKFFSISEFKLHAGDMLQKPCLNLFLRSGKSYVLCQLQAWSLEYKTRKDAIPVMDDEETEQNDDTCGHCGDGGELICCDNCPSSYHQACLLSKELPEDRWYCPNCICDVCGVVVNIMEAPSAMATLECSQCQHRYHDKCIKEKVTRNEEVASRTWFCGVDCQEVYLGLRSLVGVMNCVGDGFSSTVLRCNHGDKTLQSAEEIAVVAECNMKLAIALSIMEECFLPMVDLKTGIDMIPHILYNWGSKLPRLNYKGFYTAVLEKNDELISVASIRIHSVKVAEMPLIATRSEHRRRGMCRRLLAAIEEMLKSLKVEMLVLSAIPTLVETWTSVFGFKQLEDTEKWLQNIDLMSFPGTVLLKKSLYDATTKTSATNDEVPTRPSSSGMQGMMKDGNTQERVKQAEASTVVRPVSTGCFPQYIGSDDFALTPVITSSALSGLSLRMEPFKLELVILP